MTVRRVTTEPEYNEAKFIELLLYVAKLMLRDPSNGSVKLNKVLFFSDMLHYARFGTPITGMRYVKHRFGPAPSGYIELESRLSHEGVLEAERFAYEVGYKRIIFPKREADLSIFTGTEIAMVNGVLAALKGKSAEEVSELSHALAGWRVAKERELIPYNAIFLYDGPVTERDKEDGRRLMKELRAELEDAGVAVTA